VFCNEITYSNSYETKGNSIKISSNLTKIDKNKGDITELKDDLQDSIDTGTAITKEINKITACPYSYLNEEDTNSLKTKVEKVSDFFTKWENGDRIASKNCIVSLVVFLKKKEETISNSSEFTDSEKLKAKNLIERLHEEYPFYIPAVDSIR